jgi:SAM-dependent methyltransferase
MGPVTLTNPFDTPLAARCYARGRPAYHDGLMFRIRERLALSAPVPLALDVGCGTGQSAAALRPIARRVLGLDPSRHMLRRALRFPGSSYARAVAERLPVRDGVVSLLTCGASYHWFDRDAFLAELRRVLSPGAAAVVYDNFFTEVGLEDSEFSRWNRGPFLQRFPKPPRNSEFDPAPAVAAGFSVAPAESYAIDLPMGLEDLAAYLLSQSNVQATLAEDPALLGDAEGWLRSELRRFFAGSERIVVGLGGPLWLLRRT